MQVRLNEEQTRQDYLNGEDLRRENLRQRDELHLDRSETKFRPHHHVLKIYKLWKSEKRTWAIGL